jgi:hypothetical protein
MTQNFMTSALEASGPKKYFFAFCILLDGLAHISAIFLLKMQKKSKIGSPYPGACQISLQIFNKEAKGVFTQRLIGSF